MFSCLLLCVLVQTVFTSVARTESYEEYIRRMEKKEKIENAFMKYNITEDFIKYIPEEILGVYYGNTSITPGARVPAGDVASSPGITFENCHEELRYVLLMVCFVAEGAKPTGYLHWLCIPDCSFRCDDTNLKRYKVPTTRGGHRYVYALFEKLTYDNEFISRRSINRSNFSINKFAEKNRLGRAKAVNLMITSDDTSLPSTPYS